tara:strand:+ start:164 stop:724 length:561 start_codon:yes stop_codon:yes gene_type:complete
VVEDQQDLFVQDQIIKVPRDLIQFFQQLHLQVVAEEMEDNQVQLPQLVLEMVVQVEVRQEIVGHLVMVILHQLIHHKDFQVVINVVVLEEDQAVEVLRQLEWLVLLEVLELVVQEQQVLLQDVQLQELVVEVEEVLLQPLLVLVELEVVEQDQIQVLEAMEQQTQVVEQVVVVINQVEMVEQVAQE